MNSKAGPCEAFETKMWATSTRASLKSEPYKFAFFHKRSRHSLTANFKADGGKTEGNFLNTAAK